jgi:hypothetical protein
MKILKVVLTIIVVIIAIPLVIALFVKGDYVVEREILISKPKQDVFNYVKYLKNQDNFSVWNMMDPAMKRDFKGTDGTVGATAMWDSNVPDLGQGEQQITGITEGERVDFALRFKKPMEMEDQAYLVTESSGNDATKVKWGFKGNMPYPKNFMCLFIDMDKELGGALQKGLENLKGLLEKDNSAQPQ